MTKKLFEAKITLVPVGFWVMILLITLGQLKPLTAQKVFHKGFVQ